MGPRLDATYDTEKKMPEASLRRMQMETATKIAEKLPLKARAGQGPGLARVVGFALYNWGEIWLFPGDFYS